MMIGYICRFALTILLFPIWLFCVFVLNFDPFERFTDDR